MRGIMLAFGTSWLNFRNPFRDIWDSYLADYSVSGLSNTLNTTSPFGMCA
jgi:hypothetical protein